MEDVSEHGKRRFFSHLFPALSCFTSEKLICKSQHELSTSSTKVQEWWYSTFCISRMLTPFLFQQNHLSWLVNTNKANKIVWNIAKCPSKDESPNEG